MWWGSPANLNEHVKPQCQTEVVFDVHQLIQRVANGNTQFSTIVFTDGNDEHNFQVRNCIKNRVGIILIHRFCCSAMVAEKTWRISGE